MQHTGVVGPDSAQVIMAAHGHPSGVSALWSFIHGGLPLCGHAMNATAAVVSAESPLLHRRQDQVPGRLQRHESACPRQPPRGVLLFEGVSRAGLVNQLFAISMKLQEACSARKDFAAFYFPDIRFEERRDFLELIDSQQAQLRMHGGVGLAKTLLQQLDQCPKGGRNDHWVDCSHTRVSQRHTHSPTHTPIPAHPVLPRP